MLFLNILFTPKSVFNTIKEKPTWLSIFLILSVLYIAVTVLNMPMGISMAIASLHKMNMTEASINVFIEASKKMQYVGLLLRPLGLLFFILFYSSIIYLGVCICSGIQEFKRIFSLVTNCYVVIILSLFINYILLNTLNISVNSALDMDVIGIHNLLLTSNSFVNILLSKINFFDIWFIILLSYGLKSTTEITKLNAFIIILLSWLVTVLISSWYSYVFETAIN